MAPAVVSIDVNRCSTRRFASIAPAHETIAPLRTEPRTWVNRNDSKATGYIIWPRGYTKGKRYPAIVITHGTDADERFANQENQRSEEHTSELQSLMRISYAVFCLKKKKKKKYIQSTINDYSNNDTL